MTARRFSTRQRIALALVSGGRCAACGCRLEKGWHADHVEPWSRGGPTDVVNGQALCPACNQTKGGAVMFNIELREWQERGLDLALAKYRAGGRVFVAGVSVGGGKTFFGAAIAKSMLEAGLIDLVVIVSPSGSIQQGWSDDMSTGFGVSIRCEAGNADLTYGIPLSEKGYSTTYQSVDAGAELHRALALTRGGIARNCRTLLILDEAHHIGVDAKGQPTTWAQSVRSAFDGVAYVLVLTGTPGRSDGLMIPFVEYRDGKAILDITYSYGRAVNDGIVRRCAFAPIAATGHVQIDDDVVVTASTGDTRSKARAAVEKSSLNIWPSHSAQGGEVGVAAELILDKAIDELDRIRKQHPRAAALAVCDNVEHAQYVAQCLQARGEKCVVVTSETRRAADAIRAFKTGTAPWIVAVQMVAEGVNVKRLRVCAYLTRRRTTLALEQIMGRVVRTDWADEATPRGEIVEIDDETGDPLAPGEAVFVHLNKPELMEWTKSVEDEMVAAARERDDEETETARTGSTVEPGDYEYSVSGLRAEALGEVIKGVDFSPEVAHLAQNFRHEFPSLTRLLANQLARLAVQKLGNQVRLPVPATAAPPDVPERVQKEQIRKRTSTLVNRIAIERGLSYGKVHAWANRRAGIRTVRAADIQQLRRKEQILQDAGAPDFLQGVA
jgi:superfamily II DNA or RNA helicase